MFCDSSNIPAFRIRKQREKNAPSNGWTKDEKAAPTKRTLNEIQEFYMQIKGGFQYSLQSSVVLIWVWPSIISSDFLFTFWPNERKRFFSSACGWIWFEYSILQFTHTHISSVFQRWHFLLRPFVCTIKSMFLLKFFELEPLIYWSHCVVFVRSLSQNVFLHKLHAIQAAPTW